MDAFLKDAADFLPILLQGCLVTVEVTLCALALSTVLGFVWTLARISPIRPLAKAAGILIATIRGIPIIVQLFYIYFVMPEVGIQLSAFQAGVIGLGIAYSVYQAEIFRAGILAIGHGQADAGRSLGLTGAQTMRHVILPQAIRVILPPYGNTMIMILKDSSIVSTITVAELTRSGQLIAASTFKNMTVYTLVAMLYLAMSVPLTMLTSWLEKRHGRGYQR
jgi:polar amino acid transport system permease protein